MLVLTPDVPAPQRAQGCFLSDKEIQKVVRHWRAQSAGATAAPIVATQQRLPIAERPMDGAGLPTASNVPAAAATAPPWETAPDFAAIVKADTAEANSGSGTGDSLFDEAVATVRLQGKASISLLQRRLRIGYTRAARMIEEMEEKGIVGPNTPGSQFRDVLPPKA
jgi:S-DNA-T family DNA segregation ATPase FtsK/SpoIIIE